MKITKPALNATFAISADAVWPTILFTTDATGSHTWTWKIQWDKFSASGKVTTPSNTWDAKTVITNLGGTLTVSVKAGTSTATVTVKITGANPTSTAVKKYLSLKSNSEGFDKIINHESKFKQFNDKGDPIKSLDNGFGMCQLTNPAPTMQQVWNWKSNIDAGLTLFETKRKEAIAYLKAHTSTSTQVLYETVCRWNGGSYHEWDTAAKKWVRKKNILCDSKTGNIGWDMNDPANKGKTETVLHNRDVGGYGKLAGGGSHWMPCGVCFADKILG